MQVFINPMSGSVPTDGAAQLRAILEDHGEHTEIHEISSSDPRAEILDHLGDSQAEDIIVWGGDGTIACAFDAVWDQDIAVLPLPGGTMNLLHKQVHGEFTDWIDCLEAALKKKHRRRIPYGRAGSFRFYVGLIAGKLTSFTEVREAVREGHVLQAVDTLIHSDALDLEPRLEVAGHEFPSEALEATNVGALINGSRKEEKAVLDIGVLDPKSHLNLAKTAFAAMVNDWRELPEVDFVKSRHFTLSSRNGEPICATLDGEPAELAQKVEVEILERGPTIWTSH